MKVSIVTTAYNSARTLKDTILSVLGQTYQDIEYIIVDGGSTDGTQEVIKTYAPKFGNRIKWISEPDRGIYDGMNKGIAMATGDVVGTLNSDDYFTATNVVERMVEAFRQHDTDAVYGDIHFVREGAPDKMVRYYSSRPFHPFWLRFGFMPAHPSFYLKRSVYTEAGGYKLDYLIGADYEMMVRLFRKRKITATYLPMDFVTMRTGGVSTRRLKSRLTLLHEDVRACRENGIYTNVLMISLKYLWKVFEWL